MTRVATSWLWCALLAAGCGGEDGGGPMADGGERSDGAEMDAPRSCSTDEHCSDGTVCNGAESCAPADPAADDRGCVPAATPLACDDRIACTIDACSEEEGGCISEAPDTDGDGHGDVACVDGDGVPVGDDCNDADSRTYPGNTEVCDGHDEDCNEDTFGFLDADGDGAASSACCNDATCGPDCDDANNAVGPGRIDGPPMACDNVDNDCDGTRDEGCPCVEGLERECGSEMAIMRIGVCRPGTQICVAGAWTESCTDEIRPSEEICDEADNDCDSMTDEAVMRTYYRDGDGDGFGTMGEMTTRCSAPLGYVASATDCNDTDGSVNPGATEVCNGRDDNCNTMTDEGLTATFYLDVDRDGYGDPTMTMTACFAPAGHVASGTDCNDAVATVHPGAADVCNGVDDDCDMTPDRGCTCTDGLTRACGASSTGICRMGTQRCISGAWAECVGVVDARTETCNGLDDDCDGSTDETLTVTCYADVDSDSYGGGGAVQRCPDPTRGMVGMCPSGYTNVTGDCNDASATIRPMGTETCNGADDDCDTMVDDGVLLTYYRDADGDGYGALAMTRTGCTAPAGYVSNSTDCDDTTNARSPAQPERCDAGMIDEDCDGTRNEGCACTEGSTQVCGATDTGECSRGLQTCISGVWGSCVGEVVSRPETCNGLDDDCDAMVDDGATATGCYVDFDGDTYGVGGATTQCRDAARPGGCPLGYTNRATPQDCNDGTMTVSPVAAETCNAVDDDCDGTRDETFACVQGTTGISCATGCGTTGTRDCSMTCTLGTCRAASETCNGCDDDGDAMSDEGFTCRQGQTRACTTTCGTPGTETCAADCSGYAFCRGTEVCNGCDDDLDGAADETFSCVAGQLYGCTNSCGTAWSRPCSATCALPACTPPFEACNYCDDNGDGRTDDEASTATRTHAWDAADLSCNMLRLTEIESGCSPAIYQFQVTGAASDRGAAWWGDGNPGVSVRNPLTLGYGPLRVTVTANVDSLTGSPADGWAVLLTEVSPTTFPAGVIGAGGSNLGIPGVGAGRQVIEAHWRFYTGAVSPGSPDSIEYRAAAGTGPLSGDAAGYPLVAVPAPVGNHLNGGGSFIEQEITIEYQPSVAGSAASVAIYAGNRDGTGGGTPVYSRAGVGVPRWLPGTQLWIGVTGGTSAAEAARIRIQRILVSVNGHCYPDGAVRLAAGGRVEIFRAGSWGTVCDDLWDDADARAVCRELGLPGGTALQGPAVPDGTGPIWIDEAACGAFDSFSDCPVHTYGWHDCTHPEDAGVTCP